MLLSELEAKIKALREEHGDLKIGIYHPMAKKWVSPYSNQGAWFVTKEQHDLYHQSLLEDQYKYSEDFIGLSVA